jgi:hypothetical protein
MSETIKLSDSQKAALAGKAPNPKVRVRVGVKDLPLFKNAGIAVRYVPMDVFQKAQEYIEPLKELLRPYFGGWVDKLVVEES